MRSIVCSYLIISSFPWLGLQLMPNHMGSTLLSHNPIMYLHTFRGGVSTPRLVIRHYINFNLTNCILEFQILWSHRILLHAPRNFLNEWKLSLHSWIFKNRKSAQGIEGIAHVENLRRGDRASHCYKYNQHLRAPIPLTLRNRYLFSPACARYYIRV